LRAKAPRETLGRAAVAEVLGGIAEVQQIRDWIEDRDRLDGAALAVNRVGGFCRTGTTTSRKHQAKVPAGAPAGHSQPLRVHVVLAGIMPDVTHRAVHVLGDVHHRYLGLRDMIYGE
jgi:hypothetical protein